MTVSRSPYQGRHSPSASPVTTQAGIATGARAGTWPRSQQAKATTASRRPGSRHARARASGVDAPRSGHAGSAPASAERPMSGPAAMPSTMPPITAA